MKTTDYLLLCHIDDTTCSAGPSRRRSCTGSVIVSLTMTLVALLGIGLAL